MTLNPRREKFTRKVFNALKEEAGGDLTVQYLQDRINAENHPDVASGCTSAETIREELSQDLYAINGGTESVQEDDFLQLYADAGATMPSDDYFTSVLEREWGVLEAALARDDKEKIQRYIETMLERARQKCRPGEPQQVFLENACKVSFEKSSEPFCFFSLFLLLVQYFDIEEEGSIR